MAISLSKQMNDMFANLNRQWQEARRAEQEERKREQEVAEIERERMRTENADLKIRMLELENERREQHTQLMEVMKGLSLQLAGQPAMQLTPVREQNSSQMQPVSIGKPQAVRQAVKQGTEQAEQKASPRTPTAKEQTLEAALKLLLEEGDNTGGTIRRFLEERGHKEAAGLFTPECGEHSAAI